MQLGPGRGWGRLGTPQLCLGVEVMRASPAEPKSGQSTHGWGLFRAKMPFAWSFPTGGVQITNPPGWARGVGSSHLPGAAGWSRHWCNSCGALRNFHELGDCRIRLCVRGCISLSACGMCKAPSGAPGASWPRGRGRSQRDRAQMVAPCPRLPPCGEGCGTRLLLQPVGREGRSRGGLQEHGSDMKQPQPRARLT